MALSLSAVEQYLIRDAVLDFRTRVQSSSPLADLNTFYEEARLKDEFKLERRNIIEAFMPKISIVGPDKRDLIMKNLNTELRKFEESYLAKNTNHREKVTSFSEKFEDFLCAQYEVNLEKCLSLNKYTELEPLRNFLECEKSAAIDEFDGKWKPGNAIFCQSRKIELEMKLEILQMEAENKQREFLQGPAEEEKKCFGELKEGLLAKCEELKTYIGRSKLAYIPKCFLLEKVEGLEKFVSEKGIFSNPEFSRIHKEIFESLKGAVTGLYLAEDKLLPENAAGWAEDLDQQLKTSFQDPREIVQIQSPRDHEHIFEDANEDMREILEVESHEQSEGASISRSPYSSRTHSMDMDRSGTENITSENESIIIGGQQSKTGDLILEPRGKRRPRNSGMTSGTGTAGDSTTASKRLRLATPTPETLSIATEASGSPLIFILNHGSVTMCTLKGEDFKKLPNWKGEHSTPSVVGIDSNGTLVCGTDAWLCYERWSLADFIGKFDSEIFWKKTVTFKLNGEEKTHEITVEFLLGFLLKSLRDYAEKTMKQRFDIAIITVPAWFCNSHRIQVKDAAHIAGFRTSRLVNEETVAAYSLLSELPRLKNCSSKRKYFIFVVSENFDVVSAIVYEYSGATGKLTMSEHGYLRKIEYGSGTSSIKEKVDSLFSDVLDGEGIVPDYVTFLASSAGCRWYKSFLAAADKKGCKTSIPGSDRVLRAAVLSRMTLAQMDSMAQEYLFKEIGFARRGRDQLYHLQSHQNQNFLPKHYIITITQKNPGEGGTSKIKFSQKNVRDDKAPGVYVGELDVSRAFEYVKNNLSRLFSKSPKLQAILKVDAEGIACLECVDCIDSGETVEVKDFEWITQNLTDAKREEFVRLIQAM